MFRYGSYSVENPETGIRMYAHICGNIDYTERDEQECRDLLVENAKIKGKKASNL
ncbi:MAG: hypothetical protein ACLTML_13070 [Blautia faecis]